MSTESRLAEATTVGACADPELEASLAARFRRRILAMATLRLRDREAAEDVAQETLRAVLEAIRAERLRAVEALPAFVYQTARHVCMNHERKRAREARALHAVASTSDVPTIEPALSALIDIERRELVRRALRELSESDRRLFELLYYEELEPEAVASRLGLTNGALRVRRHRALKRLSRLIDDGERSK